MPGSWGKDNEYHGLLPICQWRRLENLTSCFRTDADDVHGVACVARLALAALFANGEVETYFSSFTPQSNVATSLDNSEMRTSYRIMMATWQGDSGHVLGLGTVGAALTKCGWSNGNSQNTEIYRRKAFPRLSQASPESFIPRLSKRPDTTAKRNLRTLV